MNTLAPFIAPALALFFIVRRGRTPRRIRPGALWVYPLVITLLALTTLSQGMPRDLEAVAVYILAFAAGAALGWFTTQHVELTLDEKTGTIMSQPTMFGTLLTAGVFAARFGLEYLINGGPGQAPHGHISPERAANLLWFADAALIFIAGRALAQAGHMWLRTRPLVAQHRAAQPLKGPTDGE
ncbi:MAG TPA: hypothetical protein VHZ78_02395 [Rhizomicrobium sp.]|jgi:hypothetical protein|nr:hypothetical protein [Rhizomicrobium sp.]